MDKEQEPLLEVPVEKWTDLQQVFRTDWPRGVTGYNILETQRRWIQHGINYDLKVFCPFGNAKNGIVAFNNKNIHDPIFIECPKDDTEELEDALRKTKVISWKKCMLILFASDNVIECIKKIVEDVNIDIECINLLQLYILNENSSLFETSLPPEITFKLLAQEHVNLVDSKWPHRYPGSTCYFQTLIQAKSGYGLFKNHNLIAWLFVKEIGSFGHLFTLEDHRRKGYGELLMKLVCNILLEDKRDVFSCCIDGNEQACSLHEKMGFIGHKVSSCHLKSKNY